MLDLLAAEQADTNTTFSKLTVPVTIFGLWQFGYTRWFSRSKSYKPGRYPEFQVVVAPYDVKLSVLPVVVKR